MKELKKWKQLRSRLVFDNQWCKVRQDEIELPTGEIIDDFFINVRPDIALVVPVTTHQEIVFVRQYRHGVGEILLELPAGAFNPENEKAEAAAAREMTEETGYHCPNLIELATLYDNPVKDTNAIHIFLGKDAEKLGQQILDITEEIEVVLVPVEKVLEKIIQGEICVSGSVAAVFLALNHLKITP
ncbi:NUDIX hydrolase [Phormidium pseudopriestleyi FRX01]|uniref:NUDIX hydrolase n=1 Tax=Phormidium pseudopriestleyi FRX01 TaxID=1759528 RepID=A0ABS3FU82_9CYAN|nr:NUDIX hydrolase [Phormidium pseudopriestleyi]MBO0349902.1 NUDIX hydrolase [Phormidium pseudopriestleyi FRX01]